MVLIVQSLLSSEVLISPITTRTISLFQLQSCSLVVVVCVFCWFNCGWENVWLTQVQHGTQTDDEDGLGHVVSAWFRVIQALLVLFFILYIVHRLGNYSKKFWRGSGTQSDQKQSLKLILMNVFYCNYLCSVCLCHRKKWTAYELWPVIKTSNFYCYWERPDVKWSIE